MTESAFTRPDTAGLILCGGRSSRMGFDKARLRFPDGLLLHRVLGHMRQVTRIIALSLAQDQLCPPVSPEVLTVRDREAQQGPLWGLTEGFRLLQPLARRVLVVPVDMPFLTASWMVRLVDGLEDGAPPYRACLYTSDGFSNALTAAYDLALLPKLERLLAEGRRRPIFISQGEPTHILPMGKEEGGQGEHPLADVDTPEAYRQALLCEGVGKAGGAAVTVTVDLSGTGSPNGAEESVALFADTASQVRSAMHRLYPEFKPEAGWPLLLTRMEATGLEVPLSEAARLNDNDRLKAAVGP